VTSSAAPAIAPSCSASRERGLVDDRRRGGVDEDRGRLHARERVASIRWRVCGVSGRAGDEVGALEQLLERHAAASARCGRPPCRSPRARRATAWPMRPKPTIPSVAPWTSAPSQRVGLPRAPLALAHVALALGSRRAAASSSAKARSAVASVSTSGVLPTGMPRAAAASRSMLSVPTA
jgi:hypothetical protein